MERTTSSERTPEGDEAFHIETHGVDEIAPNEGWAWPRDVGWLWVGANVEMETFMYGAIAGMNGAIAGRWLEPAPQSCVAGRHVRAAAWARRPTSADRRDIRCGLASVKQRCDKSVATDIPARELRNDVSAVLRWVERANA